MGKLIRMYNQNRGKFWIIVLIIVFGLVMISLFDNVAKKQNEENAKKIAQESNDTEKNKYYNESKSMVTGTDVPGSVKNDFGSLIENFLNYCKNHEPEKAYGLLSSDCKKTLYPEEWLFEQQYYKSKFSTSKRYSFQSWTASDTYIYLVKIFDDMLSTGTGSSQKYIQDYFSVVQENGEYKLNINGFIKKEYIGKSTSKNDVTITIKEKNVYMDYSTYSIGIKNNSNKTVVLDSNRDTNTIYVVDGKNMKTEAMVYENDTEDFKIKAGKEKQIEIKFGESYQENNYINKIVFEDFYFDSNSINYGVNNEKIEVNLKD